MNEKQDTTNFDLNRELEEENRRWDEMSSEEFEREILEQCWGPDWVAYTDDNLLSEEELAKKQKIVTESNRQWWGS